MVCRSQSTNELIKHPAAHSATELAGLRPEAQSFSDRCLVQVLFPFLYETMTYLKDKHENSNTKGELCY
jgi:hypothetical protein